MFAAAQPLGFLGAGVDIDRLIDHSTLPADAPGIARNAPAAYFSAALIMPYEPFFRACKETRYDIERRARRFKASFEQVCHRMTTLQRPGLAFRSTSSEPTSPGIFRNVSRCRASTFRAIAAPARAGASMRPSSIPHRSTSRSARCRKDNAISASPNQLPRVATTIARPVGTCRSAWAVTSLMRPD